MTEQHTCIVFVNVYEPMADIGCTRWHHYVSVLALSLAYSHKMGLLTGRFWNFFLLKTRGKVPCQVYHPWLTLRFFMLTSKFSIVVANSLILLFIFLKVPYHQFSNPYLLERLN